METQRREGSPEQQAARPERSVSFQFFAAAADPWKEMASVSAGIVPPEFIIARNFEYDSGAGMPPALNAAQTSPA